MQMNFFVVNFSLKKKLKTGMITNLVPLYRYKGKSIKNIRPQCPAVEFIHWSEFIHQFNSLETLGLAVGDPLNSQPKI